MCPPASSIGCRGRVPDGRRYDPQSVSPEAPRSGHSQKAKKAEYMRPAGDREAAAAAYKDTEEKTTGSGPKLDLVFSMLR